MRTLFVIFFLLSSPAFALSTPEARHLLDRTGFGASPSDIARLRSLTREEAVDDLLANVRTEALTPPPTWAMQSPVPDQKPKTMTPEDKMAFEKMLQAQRLELKAWWMSEMISTPSPFTEHLTLFWHNHFTSSLEKVHWPGLMYRQNILLRRYAAGNFREFLSAIAKDPAMVLYLDTQSNHKGHPNENFGRELLELFTLGEGNYSEKDIREASRAFTGWEVDMKTGDFIFRSRPHDDDRKEFMGEKGRLDGQDILTILLKNPRVSEFITQKLWREFVSEKPDHREIKRLAAILRNNDYALKPLLRALLLSRTFWDPKTMGTLTKSPVDLIVGTVRTFQMPIDDAQSLVSESRALGQDLMDPPNVKGWIGGSAWISTYSFMERRQFLARLLRGKEMEGKHSLKPAALPNLMISSTSTSVGLMSAPMMSTLTVAASSVAISTTSASMMMAVAPHVLQPIDLNEWMGLAGLHDTKDIDKAEQVLLPLAEVTPLPKTADLPTDIRAMVLDPVYQLK